MLVENYWGFSEFWRIHWGFLGVLWDSCGSERFLGFLGTLEDSKGSTRTLEDSVEKIMGFLEFCGILLQSLGILRDSPGFFKNCTRFLECRTPRDIQTGSCIFPCFSFVLRAFVLPNVSSIVVLTICSRPFLRKNSFFFLFHFLFRKIAKSMALLHITLPEVFRDLTKIFWTRDNWSYQVYRYKPVLVEKQTQS